MRQTAVAGRVHANEMASLAERLIYLQAVRAGFVLVVVVAAALAPELVGVTFLQVAAVSAAYIGVTLVAEGLRRLIGRGLVIVAIGLMIDGVYLAWLAYVTGGVHSPLRFLVYVHLIAVTILASYRSGLKIALWHSLLIFGLVYLENAGILNRVTTPLLPAVEDARSLQRLAVLNVTAFWIVALGAAVVSSINERELRRRKLDLEGLTEMAAKLENSSEPGSIAEMTLAHVVSHFGFERGAFIALHDGEATVLASQSCVVPEGPLGIDGLLERAGAQKTPILVKRLDPTTDPSLDALMPQSRNVMVIPLVAEAQIVGALVLEKPAGRARVPRQVVAMISQFAAHAALGLRNAWLMATVQRMAETDALTGVANRRVFEETLERELSRATRSGEQVTLVMIDVDHFKRFNDTYGHQTGDEVLRGAAQMIEGELRQFDTLARYGGEEFAVILPECSTEEAGLVAERLRQSVSHTQAPTSVTASAGVATFPADATNRESLIRAADDALYASKDAGRNRVTLHRRLAEAQLNADVAAVEEVEASAGRWADSRRGRADVATTDARGLTLARAGATLTAADSAERIHEAIMEAVVTLIDEAPNGQVLLAAGNQLEAKVVSASGTRVAAGHVISLHGQPDPLVPALVEHRSVEGALSPERASAWGLDPAPEHVFAIPLVVQGQLAAALLVGSRTPLGEEMKYALELIGAKATAALERLAVQKDLETIEKKFTSLISGASDGISIVDVEGTILYQTPALERLLGYRDEELVGTELTDLVHPDDAGNALRFISKLAHEEITDLATEWRMRRYDGSFVYVSARGRNLLNDPDLNGLVLTIQDVTDRKALEQEVSVLASRDLLTNLGNRPFFLDHLHHALLEPGTAGALAVLLLNLDDFKIVNDSLGPEAGDDLIVEVAERLRGCLRRHDSLARLGGDEFAILLRDADGPNAIRHVARRLQDALKASFEIRHQHIFITATMGVALHEQGHSPADLLRNADVAMHLAKQVDKGGYRIFEASMHAAAVDRLELTNDLQRAIDQQELRVVFQPIVDLATDEIAAMEALVRWDHPRRGAIAPSEFVPLAEETGLILPLGRWVLDQVARRMRSWRATFPERPIPVSVNLSALQVVQPDFVEDIRVLLGTYEITPADLILEITETVFMDDTAGTLSRLTQLRSLGVRLALDDFGTGYSSLGYLRSFPVDILKIDRSFIEGLGSEPGQAELLDAIVRMGRGLDMITLAEGIEDAEQLKVLRRLGCDLGQGFLFCRPLPAEELHDMLAGRERRVRADRSPG